MTWELLKELVQSLINSIQNTGISAVRTLNKTITTHTYPVTIKNPVKKVEVAGSVRVTNPSNNKDVIITLKELKKALLPYKSIKVENFPKQTPFPKFPEFPKKIEVSNQQDKVQVTNFDGIVKALFEVQTQVKKLKLDPKIQVNAPIIPAPIIHVEKTPSPTVNVEKPDLSEFKRIMVFLEGLDAKNPLAVRLSDGKAFYRAIDKLGELYTANTESPFQDIRNQSARPMVNRNGELQVTISDTWDGNDVDKVSSTLTYAGEESVDGKWRVRKITKSGTITSIRHATIRNNPTYLDYESAWGDRTNLSFEYAREAL